MSEYEKQFQSLLVETATKARAIGREEGRNEGLQEGQVQGFTAGVPYGVAIERSRLRKAISSGVRHGCPECASELRSTDWRQSDEFAGYNFRDENED